MTDTGSERLGENVWVNNPQLPGKAHGTDADTLALAQYLDRGVLHPYCRNDFETIAISLLPQPRHPMFMSQFGVGFVRHRQTRFEDGVATLPSLLATMPSRNRNLGQQIEVRYLAQRGFPFIRFGLTAWYWQRGCNEYRIAELSPQGPHLFSKRTIDLLMKRKDPGRRGRWNREARKMEGG